MLLTNDDGPDSPFFKAWVPYVRNTLGCAGPAHTHQCFRCFRQAAWQALLCPWGQGSWKCFVCLPARPESFVSKSVAKGPLTVESVSSDTWHVHGPPASAANIALYHLAPQCDFVVSGPNIGHNAGRYAGCCLASLCLADVCAFTVSAPSRAAHRASVLSSGTVGAAMEGVLAGRKAIAISFPFFSGFNNWSEEEVADAVQVHACVVSQFSA